jgi:hypothetical protein
LIDTLLVFMPGKEGTCNVHHIQAAFLEAANATMPTTTTMSGGEKEDEDDDEEEGRDEKREGGEAVNNDHDVSLMYFIVKLVWVKGFNQMLNLQDIYWRRHAPTTNTNITSV